MQKQESDQLISYLDRIIESTLAGDMVWAKVNPTTYTWSTDKPKIAKFTLQQVIIRRVMRSGGGISTEKKHLLQVRNDTGIEVLATDGADDSAVINRLSTAFEAAAASVTRKGLDFLNEVLPHK